MDQLARCEENVPKRTLRIRLDELKTVRVKCKRCKVVFEVPTGDVKGLFSNGQCQCGAVVDSHGHNPLERLVDTLLSVAELRKVLEIEFVVPARD